MTEDERHLDLALAVPEPLHHTDTSETLEYITGWNDCRQAMLAAMLAEQPPLVQGWRPSEADYKDWWDRHGLHGPTARAAFEDAASLYLTATPQPAQQEPEILQRVKRYAGQTLRTARNPNITARECIELADWLAAHSIKENQS